MRFGTVEDLASKVIELATEGLADDTRGHLNALRHVGDLQQHRRHVVDTLEKLDVDVHMEGDLTLLLVLQLVSRLLDLLALSKALGEKLLDAATRPDVVQGVVCGRDDATAERTKTELDHGSVVENLM